MSVELPPVGAGVPHAPGGRRLLRDRVRQGWAIAERVAGSADVMPNRGALPGAGVMEVARLAVVLRAARGVRAPGCAAGPSGSHCGP